MARRSTARGSFLRRCKCKGKSLISVSGKGYKVKGVKTKFKTFGSAKSAANKIAYAKRR